MLFDKGKPISIPLEIVTDSDPRNLVTRKTLEHAHFITRVTIAENNFELPKHVQLFLELYSAENVDERPYARYYLVDLDNQTVFWAADINTKDLCAHMVNPKTFSEQHLSMYLVFVECSRDYFECRAATGLSVLVAYRMLSIGFQHKY